MMRRFRQFPTIGGRRGGIPADCVEVKYLQTDGNSWINTNVYASNADTVLEVIFERSSTASNHVLIGAGNLVYLAWINATYLYQAYCSGNGALGGRTVTDGTTSAVVTMTTSGSSILMGGYIYTSSTLTLTNNPTKRYAIFSAAATGESYNGSYFRSPSGERICSAKFSQGGVVVADLVPVRRVENGVSVGYMCDRLTGELYGNQGTGAFVVGPDKGAWTNPYVTDGLVAMWDGEWNAGGGVHDDQLRLVDLSGNCHDMTFVGDCSLGSNCVTIPGKSGAYGTVTGLEFGTPSSQELVTAITDYTPYGRFVGENRGIVGLGGRDTGRLYGWGKDAIIADVYYNYGQIFAQSLSVGNSDAEYYFNGSSRGSISITATQYSGQTTFFNRTSGGRGLDGNLYTVRFYNRALTASEIAANYAVDRERFGLS